MNVTIGEVQAQVESTASSSQGAPSENGKQLGLTEKAREARLADRRAHRLRERLSAT